jgi:hypothetical protein
MQIQLGCGAYYKRWKVPMARESCFEINALKWLCHKEVSFQILVAFV